MSIPDGPVFGGRPRKRGYGSRPHDPELAETVRDLVYPEGELVFDASRPDGMPRKVLDVSRLTDLGWTATPSLAEGLADTYRWYLEAAEWGVLRL